MLKHLNGAVGGHTDPSLPPVGESQEVAVGSAQGHVILSGGGSRRGESHGGGEHERSKKAPHGRAPGGQGRAGAGSGGSAPEERVVGSESSCRLRVRTIPSRRGVPDSVPSRSCMLIRS